MENQNTMPQGSQSPMPQSQPPAPEKSVGALVGSIIIVIILIVGGFYLWSTKVIPVAEPVVPQPAMEATPATETLTPEEQALNQPDLVLSQMAAVAISDEVSAIDADLKATNLDEMGAELQ